MRSKGKNGKKIIPKNAKEKVLPLKVPLDSIISSMAYTLIVVNPDSTLRSLNKAALDLLGYREDELIGRKLNKIFLQEDNILYKYLQGIIAMGSAHNIDLTFLTKQGREIPVNFNWVVIRQNGKITGIAGVGRNMSRIMSVISDLEKKQRDLEERSKDFTRMQRALLHMMDDLQEASRARDEFSNMVTHELRTPLAAIKESVALVFDKVPGNINEEQEKYLGIAKKNVERLDRLICGILDFQGLKSGKVVFAMEENNINEVVREMQQTMLPLARKKNLDFVCQLDESLPLLKFDRDKILQVLINLTNNSIKLTEKGAITVSTGNDGENFIQITIKDTGPGIKEEDLPKLFQQFTQLQRRVGGTGLGLSICKQIIEAHKGKIWAESEFGKGTAFQFILPIKERRI